jgi:hypothetical protein
MRVLLFCLLCVAILVTACGEKAKEQAMEKEIEKATGSKADVDLSKKGMKVSGKTEEGEYKLETGEEAEIPEDFPDDVFIYTPSKAVMAMKIPQGHSVTLMTKDDITKVVDAYKHEMEAKGWTEEAYTEMDDKKMLTYRKDGRIAGISLGKSDKGLQIIVTTGTE